MRLGTGALDCCTWHVGPGSQLAALHGELCMCHTPTWVNACSAAGVDLWKRNLQLLVPFLVQPKIALHSTRMQGSGRPVGVEASACACALCTATCHPRLRTEMCRRGGIRLEQLK